MNEQIDWSLAPEGATHKVLNGCWYKVSGDSVSFFNGNGEWNNPLPLKNYAADWPYFIPRPPTWNGPADGLPPVGLDVEIRLRSMPERGEWYRAKILFCRDTALVFEWAAQGTAYATTVCQVEIRPIYTPEQLEDREKAVKEMQNIVTQGGLFALYDAGYIKQVQP